MLMRQGAVLLKHKRNRLRATCACLAVASEQENCRDSLTPNLSNVILTNPALGKNLEHPPLTR